MYNSDAQDRVQGGDKNLVAISTQMVLKAMGLNSSPEENVASKD